MFMLLLSFDVYYSITLQLPLKNTVFYFQLQKSETNCFQLHVCLSVSTSCHYVVLTTHCCSQWSDIYMCLVCLKRR